MRYFCLLLLLLPAVAGAQNVPEATRPMGEEYRFIWNKDNNSPTRVVIRFPRISNDSNIIPAGSHGVFADSINTTKLGPHTVWHVTLQQVTRTRDVGWIIYSPCFPAGADTVWTNAVAPSFTLSGCPIDSINASYASTTPGVSLQLLASD